MKFGVWGLEFRAWGLGCRVRVRVSGFEFRVLGFEVYPLLTLPVIVVAGLRAGRLRVSGSGVRVTKTSVYDIRSCTKTSDYEPAGFGFGGKDSGLMKVDVRLPGREN